MRGFLLVVLAFGAILFGASLSGVLNLWRPAATQALGGLQSAARQAPSLPFGHASTRDTWQEISPGVQMRRWRATAEGVPVSIVAVRASASRLRVAAGATLDVEAWRRRTGAIVAVNGGFFDVDGRTMGLRIARGRQLSSLRQADWGIFYVTDGRARMLHTRDWKDSRSAARADEAVQCGPRLVVNGKPLHFKPQWARRTGVGVMRDGRVVLAVTEDEISFRSWAALWARSDGMNCRSALNLDGGGSTQMAVRAGQTSVDVNGATAVPDVVMFK